MADGAALFVQSLLIGLSIAAPVGPIGLLVIQRTLRDGRAFGLATGLGAAAADAFYGAIGAFGVHSLIELLTGARVPLALFGGAFLLWLAWSTWRSAPATQAAQVAQVAQAAQAAQAAGNGLGRGRGHKLFTAFAGTLLLTLSNPATIFSFIAVFGSLSAHGAPASPWPMISGVLLGSAAWWLLLSTLVARLRSRFDARVQRWVNRISAAVLAAFALWQWLALLAGS